MQASPLKIALCGFVMLAVAMGIGRFAFTPLLPIMLNDGLITITDGGLLASVHFVGYLMGALIAGQILKWPSLMLFSSLVLIAISTITMGITNYFVIWLGARWLAGLCSAIVLVIVSSHIVKILVELEEAKLQNMVFAGVGGGILITGLMTHSFLVLNVSSNSVWITIGLISLLFVIIVYFQIGKIAFRAPPLDQSMTKRVAPLNWRLIIPYGAVGIGYIIPATYLPIMASNVIESPTLYAMGWPIFGMAAMISTLTVVWFQSHYSDRHIWIVSQLIMAIGLIVPANLARTFGLDQVCKAVEFQADLKKQITQEKLSAKISAAPSACECAVSHTIDEKRGSIALHAASARLVKPLAIQNLKTEFMTSLHSPTCASISNLGR